MDATEYGRRLHALRAELVQRELEAYLVPKSDEYMLEYAPACSERLAWLTGFTGSAGMAIVGRERAALFIDGRYTEQAQRQTPRALWELCHLTTEPPASWLERTIAPAGRVGYDPRIHSPASLDALRQSIESVGATLYPVESNLIDLLWTDRPPPPTGLIELYPDGLAGETSGSKRTRMARELAAQRLDALVLSAPENVAWLLNVRGRDVPNTPLVLARAILHQSGDIELYVSPGKLAREVLEALCRDGAVTVRDELEFEAGLSRLAEKIVRVDRSTASEWLIEKLESLGALVDVGADPCTLAKACKTGQELAAIRAAHVRDGVAVTRFLAWFSRHASASDELQRHDEVSVARELERLRREGEHYRGPSFDTISAFGPSSALPHYRASADSALPLDPGDIYLVDSGGQYLDGTTDVTRVTVTGEPTPEMRRRYTQVLQGHIALARARFPAGTTGSQLDAFARQFLWRDGVDFDHGTGHGVGCYLSVHEGPQNISKRPSKVALRPGMIVSNEPGYYKPGAFGIRIENLIAVTELDPQPPGAERTTLGFETLTLVPYERRLIDVTLLTPDERAWVDGYHARVRSELEPLLEGEAREYLCAVTAPLPTA